MIINDAAMDQLQAEEPGTPMNGSPRMKAVLLQNPTAGDQSLSTARLMSLIEDAGYSTTFQSTKELDLSAIDYRETGLIVIAGGDGTVAKVVTRLPERSVPLALLPTGTANNVARSLGIEGKPEEIMAGWTGADWRELNVGLVRGSNGDCRFVEGVGFGSFAQSLARSSKNEDVPEDDDGRAQKMRRGRELFRRALEEDRPQRLDVRIDGQQLPQELLFVEILNIAYVGPGLNLASLADPGDGILDVVYIEPDRRAAMLAWLAGARQAPPPVERLRGREVTIGCRGGLMRVDDDCISIADDGEQITVALERERVKFLAAPDLDGAKSDQQNGGPE